MLLVQIVLYCLLYALFVKCAAKDSGLNCLYFYPKEYIDEAQKRGLADKNAVMKKGKRFMAVFCLVMLVVLVLIISVWNRVTDFKTAYIQACIILVVVNWFDALVIDRLWVGHGGRPLRQAVEDRAHKAGSQHGGVSHHLARRRRHRGAGRENINMHIKTASVFSR